MRPKLFSALLLLLALTGACAAPTPSHLARLWPVGQSGEPMLGLSTEEGVLILSSPNLGIGDWFHIQFPVGNSGLGDWGILSHLNDDLAVVRPLTARLEEGRLASAPPKPQETIYLALRSAGDQPVMRAVTRWNEGSNGDYVTVSGQGPAEVAARNLAGSGLYVLRDRRWKIIGMLAGTTARLPQRNPNHVGLGYIRLNELARVLPDQIDYFERDIKPLRPDFEFGVPLQPGDMAVPLPPQEDDDPSGRS
jgi:hypothetical protein